MPLTASRSQTLNAHVGGELDAGAAAFAAAAFAAAAFAAAAALSLRAILSATACASAVACALFSAVFPLVVAVVPRLSAVGAAEEEEEEEERVGGVLGTRLL